MAAYVCKLPDKRGAFLPDKAAQLGVPRYELAVLCMHASGDTRELQSTCWLHAGAACCTDASSYYASASCSGGTKAC